MKYALILFVLFLSACQKAPTPEEVVSGFFITQKYEYLSDIDKKSMSAEEWKKAARHNPSLPVLSPTNKYFELERFLRSKYSYSVLPHAKDGENLKVTVVERFPEVLHELYFFNENTLDLVKDELEQALVNFNKGLLEESVKMKEVSHDFTVFPDGIYLNLAERKVRQARFLKIREITESFAHVKSYELLRLRFFFSNPKQYAELFALLREKGIEEISKDFENLASSIEIILNLEPEYPLFSYENMAGELYSAKIALKADKFFSENIEISNAEVANTSRNEKALFFDWKFKKRPTEELFDYYAGFTATFFDDSGMQIGYEEYLSPQISTEGGNQGGSVGVSIKNKNIANRSKRVEVRYFLPFSNQSLKCEAEETLTCKPR